MRTVKKAQQVGLKVKELQEELQETEIEAVAANGGVTVVISGAQVPISVDVTAELLEQGADAVSEAVSIAGGLVLVGCVAGIVIYCMRMQRAGRFLSPSESYRRRKWSQAGQGPLGVQFAVHVPRREPRWAATATRYAGSRTRVGPSM